MKIASFNINGIKARLPRLLEWLEETRPTVACLQEIKTQDEGFPAEEFEKIGYQAIWHGQKGFNGVAILADGEKPVEIQRGLAGEPEDEHSRYIEAEVRGMRIAGIYLPNGNPQPGPKFDYKLRWMDRLRKRMAEIRALEIPAIVLGDYNVIPTDRDIWSPKAMASDALMQPNRAMPICVCSTMVGPMPSPRITPMAACGPTGTIRRAPGSVTMGSASIMLCCRLRRLIGCLPAVWTRIIAGGKRPAIMRRSGFR
jgi:exonuclease III